MHHLLIGQKSPDARVYTCSRCGYHTTILKEEIAVMCAMCKKTSRWHQTGHQILLKTKNVAAEIEKKTTSADRLSYAITQWCGSLNFAYAHLL